jgi:hypothetical protein
MGSMTARWALCTGSQRETDPAFREKVFKVLLARPQSLR